MKNLTGRFMYWFLVKRTFASSKKTEKLVRTMEQTTGHKLTDEERQKLVKDLQSVAL